MIDLKHKMAFLSLALLLLHVGIACFAGSADDYQIKDTENGGFDLRAPDGSHYSFGDPRVTAGQNYTLEVPLKDLKRSPSPSEANRAPAALMPSPTPMESVTTSRAPSTAPTLAPSPVPSPSPSPTPETVPRAEDSDILIYILEANRLYNHGKYYEALNYVNEVTNRRPKYARGWIMKGSLLYVLGQKDLAKIAWDQALALSPNDAQITQMLGVYR